MNSESWAIACVLVGVAHAVGIALFVRRWRRRIVEQRSAALAELQGLNDVYAAKLQYLPLANFEFSEAAETKVKFDRADLRPVMLKQVMLHKPEVYGAIDARMADWATYLEYRTRVAQLRTQRVGRSSPGRLSAARFERIEMQQFRKHTLAAPACAVHVRCDVTFTTTQGRATYTRSLDWSLDELIRGLDAVRRGRQARPDRLGFEARR